MKRIKIVVLMSTYNGSRFLDEQLVSIINQQKGNILGIDLLVRDDGSTDTTKSILRKYANKKNLTWYTGENLGACHSFMDLIKNAPEADFYAFADQDDVWDSDKLLVAVHRLLGEERRKEIPLVYYSNLAVVDENLRFARYAHTEKEKKGDKYSSLAENRATGCTCVFNWIAMQFLRQGDPKNIFMHDWWLYLICSFFGKTIYDKESHILYRQHAVNVVGTYLSKHPPVKVYFKKLGDIVDYKKQHRRDNARAFLSVFGNKLNNADRKRVELVANYQKSFLRRIRLLFNVNIRTTDWKREILFRIRVIFGTI